MKMIYRNHDMEDYIDYHDIQYIFTSLATVYTAIFKGLILCGRQVCKDFCGIILLVIKLNTLFP